MAVITPAVTGEHQKPDRRLRYAGTVRSSYARPAMAASVFALILF
jgi:hypothetical protein